MTAQADSKKSTDDIAQKVSSVPKAKEQEIPTSGHEGEILSEIVRSSEVLDKQAEGEIQKDLSEARLADGKIDIPPDVADAGLKSPQEDANEVIKKGTTLELPITESEYQMGLHTKVRAAVVNRVVFGVSGIVGLAMWIGRMIKIAHKHAKRVVFRKEGS